MYKISETTRQPKQRRRRRSPEGALPPETPGRGEEANAEAHGPHAHLHRPPHRLHLDLLLLLLLRVPDHLPPVVVALAAAPAAEARGGVLLRYPLQPGGSAPHPAPAGRAGPVPHQHAALREHHHLRDAHLRRGRRPAALHAPPPLAPRGEDALRRDLLPGGGGEHLEPRALGGGDAVGARVRVGGDPAERDLGGRGWRERAAVESQRRAPDGRVVGQRELRGRRGGAGGEAEVESADVEAPGRGRAEEAALYRRGAAHRGNRSLNQ
uniref:Uncharacterized protein n=1 Tax=Zea mays TaxID=4577 RepID=C4J5J0_MAIZE|nr:unknown [Zea mays]